MNAALLRRLRTTEALVPLITKPQNKQKIVIDFSSPNIAKQFHIGNLRSTLIGNFLAKLHTTCGHDVSTVNYLGDWGIQFAMIATYWPQVRPSDSYWDECNIPERIRLLTDCYVVANAMMKNDEKFEHDVRETYRKMERAVVEHDSENESLKLWKYIRSLSEEHLRKFYKIFGISFTHWMSESQQLHKANAIVDELIKKNIAKQTSEGFWSVDNLPSASGSGQMDGFAIVRKSDITSLYLSRELATTLYRDELFKADRYLYVVDRSQRRHFESLKLIFERLGHGELAHKIEHVQYGRVKGLSTRNGRTELVSDVLRHGSELALKFIQESKTGKLNEKDERRVSRSLSVDAVVFNEVKRARNSEYEFSFKQAFDLNHNNALFLQMKHSRACSIEKKNEALLPLLETCDSLPQEDDDVKRLLATIRTTDEAIRESANKLESCHLTLHLLRLAQNLASATAKLRVHGEPNEVAVPRLLMFSSARHVLSSGMSLVGMTPLDEM